MQGKSRSPTLSRRQLIKGVVGAATTGSLAAAKIPTPAGADDTVRIPTVKKGDRVLKWKEVPRGWREQTLQARRSLKSIKNQFLGEKGIEGIGLSRWEQAKYGDYTGFLISVEVDHNRFSGSLPNVYEGTPVESREPRNFERTCYNYSDFDPIPGGVTVESGDPVNGVDKLGSTGFEVNDRYGNPRILSANHVWGLCDYNVGKEVYQNGNFIGSVYQSDEKIDTALIEVETDKTISANIKEPSNTRSISGYKNKSGIEELYGSNSNISKMGVTTGKNEDVITEIEYSDGQDCIDYAGEGIETAHDVATGDSGGPIYNIETILGERRAVVVGHVTAYRNPKRYKRCYDGVAEGNRRPVGNFMAGMTFYGVKQRTKITL